MSGCRWPRACCSPVLVLARAPGQTVRIGADVTVTVVGLRGRTVQLGITAPAAVVVYREELYQRLTALNREAAAAAPAAVAASAAALRPRAPAAPGRRPARKSCASCSAP